MLLKTGVVAMVFALALTAVAVVVTLASRDEPEEAVAQDYAPRPALEPLVRSKPDVEPWIEPALEPVTAEPEPKPQPEPQPEAKPEPEPRAEPEREVLPVAEENWPMPTEEEIQAATEEPRHYELPRGAVMGLTIKSLGLHNVPVFDSDGRWALNNGVAHMPGTSFPWSSSPQRNVYLAGHRLGWRGTESHLVFYDLDELGRGNEILLKNRDGKKFRYRVTEAFVTGPDDRWVMGQVPGRDMVTLQTCTPIPSFARRMIVRADRI